MVPYFFAAGHWNYVRYISPGISLIRVTFENGKLVCRHNNGFFNDEGSDQFGEQTYIR